MDEERLAELGRLLPKISRTFGPASGAEIHELISAARSLDELVGAVEDIWRRYLAGDYRAPEAFILRSTYRQACQALGRDEHNSLFERINTRSQPVDA